MTKQQGIKSAVTGQWLVGFVNDWLTGRGAQSIPVWGGKDSAIPASAGNQQKVSCAGMPFVVERL